MFFVIYFFYGTFSHFTQDLQNYVLQKKAVQNSTFPLPQGSLNSKHFHISQDIYFPHTILMRSFRDMYFLGRRSDGVKPSNIPECLRMFSNLLE